LRHTGNGKLAIAGRLPYPFEDMGEQSVKNSKRPVRVYACRPEALADLPAATLPHPIFWVLSIISP
jgi:hypothetical protein